MVQVKKDLPLEIVRGLAGIGCTQTEAAAVFHMSVAQFKRYLQEPNVREAWDAGKAEGRVEIRKLQWWHAKQKGPAGAQLTIHLSKHQLGETDTSLVKHEHSGQIAIVGGPQSVSDGWFKGVDVSRFTDAETIQFADLCDMIDHLNGAIALLPPDKFQLMTELVRKGQPAELVVEPEKLSEAIAALPPPDSDDEIVIEEDGRLSSPDFLTGTGSSIDAVLPPPPKVRGKNWMKDQGHDDDEA